MHACMQWGEGDTALMGAVCFPRVTAPTTQGAILAQTQVDLQGVRRLLTSLFLGFWTIWHFVAFGILLHWFSHVCTPHMHACACGMDRVLNHVPMLI